MDSSTTNFAKMGAYQVLELISVVFSVVFLLLLMRNNRWCWPFGIMGSAIGVFLFVWPDAEVKLYSEAILYSYYVWIGVYGWIRWNKTETSQQIKNWGLKLHLIAFGCGAILAPALGYVMDRLFDSNNPYIDATTTVFSFIASYMQAERIYTSWHFWIVINLISVWLYWNRGLVMYSGLMIIYVGLSMLGLWQWRKLRATSQ